MFLTYLLSGVGTECSLTVWVNLAARFSIDLSDYIFVPSELIPHFNEEDTESESWISFKFWKILFKASFKEAGFNSESLRVSKRETGTTYYIGFKGWLN